MNKRSAMKGAATAVLGLMALVSVSIGAVMIWASPAHGAESFSGQVIGIADGDTITVLADADPTPPWLYRKGKKQ